MENPAADKILKYYHVAYSVTGPRLGIVMGDAPMVSEDTEFPIQKAVEFVAGAFEGAKPIQVCIINWKQISKRQHDDVAEARMAAIARAKLLNGTPAAASENAPRKSGIITP